MAVITSCRCQGRQTLHLMGQMLCLSHWRHSICTSKPNLSHLHLATSTLYVEGLKQAKSQHGSCVVYHNVFWTQIRDASFTIHCIPAKMAVVMKRKKQSKPNRFSWAVHRRGGSAMMERRAMPPAIAYGA